MYISIAPRIKVSPGLLILFRIAGDVQYPKMSNGAVKRLKFNFSVHSVFVFFPTLTGNETY